MSSIAVYQESFLLVLLSAAAGKSSFEEKRDYTNARGRFFCTALPTELKLPTTVTSPKLPQIITKSPN